MNKFLKTKLAGDQRPILIALLAVAMVLVILVAIDIFKDKAPASVPSLSNVDNIIEEEPIEYKELVDMEQNNRDTFREDVPADVLVPEKDTQLSEEQKKEIALPTVVVPAATGSTSKFRSFVITASDNEFLPTKIIANIGDTVNISFTAVDKAYDIVFPSYNMMQKAEIGQTKTLQFNARKEGSFTYYCSACGGPEKGPKGSIIIVP
jgi:plastocyanin